MATPRFFVSYTSADVAWAEWVAQTLEEAGYRTVLQAWDFRPGDNFIQRMDQALAEADRVVAVLSAAYFRLRVQPRGVDRRAGPRPHRPRPAAAHPR
jgi:TIR domain